MPHSIEGLAILLLVGLAAGWLASRVVKVGRLNVAGYLVVGVVGAFIGGFIFDVLGIGFHSFLGRIVSAFVGSLILLGIAKAAQK